MPATILGDKARSGVAEYNLHNPLALAAQRPMVYYQSERERIATRL